jgi:AhpD family alkylhydroperoxidase
MTERIGYAELPKGYYDGMFKIGSYLKHSGIDRKLAELITYRVSQINGCAYCLDMHHKEAIALGETEQRLHSLAAWRDTPYYSEQERLTLAFAEAITNVNREEPDEALFEALSAFYTKADLANLAMVVANINSWNRINKVLLPVPGKYKVGQFDL